MKKLLAALILPLLATVLGSGIAGAGDDLWKKYASEYSPVIYYVGIGEVKLKGSEYAAYRVAEVHARKDIAQQIKVRVDSDSVDYACSGSASKAYSSSDCKDEFISIIKVSTDEYLSGSRVADKGKDGEYVYVVVIMLREGVARSVREQMTDSVKRATEMLEKAKAGDKAQADGARKELLKARVYKVHLESIEGVKQNSDKAFKELEQELEKL